VLGCEEFYSCDFGVDNTAGHNGVTIENGSIGEFATALVAAVSDDPAIAAGTPRSRSGSCPSHRRTGSAAA
jgi:hypothetical protein